LARYVRVRVRTALQKSRLPDLDYAVNPYVGCEHGCLYCYAPLYTRYREVAENWGGIVYVKENLIEVLAEEARRARRGVVGVSTVTDPYQPVEAEERLTRRAVELLLGEGYHVSLQTKSSLLLRDMDLLAGSRGRVDVGVTITTMRAEVAGLIEPGAPEPGERLRVLEEAARRGLDTWLFLGPIIPGVNDDEGQLGEVVEAAARTGSEVVYDFLRLKPGVAERLSRAGVHGGRLAASRSRRWRAGVEAVLARLCAAAGVECSPAFPRRVGGILDYLG